METLGGEVGQHQGDDVADDGAEEAPADAARHEEDHGPDEGKVPVVPQVDVDGLGAAQAQQHEVDGQAHGDDEGAYQRVVGHRGGGWPAHVEDLQFEVVDVRNALQRRPQGTGEEARDDSQSHESYAHVESALQGLAELDADAHTQDGEDDGHHDGGSQGYDVAKEAF